MEKTKANITNLNIKDLEYYPDNPRKHSKKQIDHLAKQIEDVGFNQPIIVDEQKRILVGNGRVEAAQKAGLENVPAIIYTDAELKELAEKKAPLLRRSRNK